MGIYDEIVSAGESPTLEASRDRSADGTRGTGVQVKQPCGRTITGPVEIVDDQGLAEACPSAAFDTRGDAAPGEAMGPSLLP